MRVDQRSIKRCDEEVKIGEQDCHGTVNDAIIAIHKALWLEAVATAVPRFN